MSDRRTDPFSTSDSGSGASALTSPVPASSALGGIAGLWPPASALLAFRIGAGADTASGVVRVPSTGARPSVSLPARDGVSSAFFIRFGAICAALYACSASHAVHRVYLIWSSITATTAWLVTRRSRGQWSSKMSPRRSQRCSTYPPET